MLHEKNEKKAISLKNMFVISERKFLTRKKIVNYDEKISPPQSFFPVLPI